MTAPDKNGFVHKQAKLFLCHIHKVATLTRFIVRGRYGRCERVL